MIVAALVCVGFMVVIAVALRLDSAVGEARERFRVLLGGYGDAGMLAAARQRVRARQQRIEAAVDTGTTGLETAHRGLSRWLTGDSDSGAGGYARIRAFNRGMGRTISGLLAPKPRRHSESLDQWRARVDDDAKAQDSHNDR